MGGAQKVRNPPFRLAPAQSNRTASAEPSAVSPILPRFMHKRGVFAPRRDTEAQARGTTPRPLRPSHERGDVLPSPPLVWERARRQYGRHPSILLRAGSRGNAPLLPPSPCPCDWAAQNPGSGLRTEGAQVKWRPSRTAREPNPRTSRVHDLPRHLSRATRASSHFAGNAAELSREDLLSPRVYLRRTARWLIYKN